MSDSFCDPWAVVCQVLLSMKIPRKEYWCGLSFPTPRYYPHLGIKAASSAWQAGGLPLSHQGTLRESMLNEKAITIWSHSHRLLYHLLSDHIAQAPLLHFAISCLHHICKCYALYLYNSSSLLSLETILLLLFII